MKRQKKKNRQNKKKNIKTQNKTTKKYHPKKTKDEVVRKCMEERGDGKKNKTKET